MSLMLALAALPASAIEFTVSPVQTALEVRPGGTVQVPLTVVNQGTETLGVKVYLWDWWYTDEGHRFEPPGTLDRSAATWFTPFPRELQLGPKQSGSVQLNGSVPEGVTAGWYAVTFVEARTLAQDDAEGMQIRPAARVGSLLMLRVAGTGEVRVESAAPAVTVDAGGIPDVRMDVAGRGDVHTFVTLRAVVRDATGAVLDRFDSRPLRLLPGQKRTLTVRGAVALLPGRYELLGTIDSDGGGDPAPIRVEFQVPGPTTP